MAIDESMLEEAFKESLDFGIRVLHESFRWTVVSCIKSEGMGLQHADVDDIYGQTILEMMDVAAREGFQKEKPMKMVLRIAKFRTRDLCRRRRLRAMHEGTEYQDHITADMQGTTVGLKAKFDIVDYQEFDAAMWEEIDNLPPMQKLAAQCFNRVYEDVDKHGYGVLADAMSEHLGRPVSRVAAKNAWYEAQDKIIEAVRRKKFDI